MDKYYVYLHKKQSDGSVYYVGKGCGDRAWDLKASSRNPLHANIHSKHGTDVCIVRCNMSNEDACSLEIELIALFRSEGIPLANITSGGDGFNSKTSLEACAIAYAMKVGIHSVESHVKAGKRGGVTAGKMTKEKKIGIHDPAKFKEHASIGGKAARDQGKGVTARSKEEMKATGSKNMSVRKVCNVCGMVTSPANMAIHQKASGHIGWVTQS